MKSELWTKLVLIMKRKAGDDVKEEIGREGKSTGILSYSFSYKIPSE